MLELVASGLGLAVALAAVAGFAYFGFQAHKLRVRPYIFRGRLAIAAGAGLCGFALAIHVFHSGRAIYWPMVTLSIVGVGFLLLGEVWERKAKKHLKTLQELAAIAEASRARMDRNAQEQPPAT